MKRIRNELNKNMSLSFLLISLVGICLLCCCSTCYTFESGRSVTILELFMVQKKVLLTDFRFSRYFIWEYGFGTWTQIFLPLFISLGYMFTISSERVTKCDRFILVRQSALKYNISKLVSIILYGGIILVSAYLLFGLIVYLKFPGLNEYSSQTKELVWQLYPGFDEKSMVIKRLLGMFLYGACMNAFAYIIAVFFNDKYILMCFPLLIRYMITQGCLKLLLEAAEKGNETLSYISEAIDMKMIINIDYPEKWVYCLAVSIPLAVYLIGFIISMYISKRRGGEFGFE